jgi:hypothetical protein
MEALAQGPAVTALTQTGPPSHAARMLRSAVAALILAAATGAALPGGAGCSDDGPAPAVESAPAAGQAPPPAAAPRVMPVEPSYPDSAAGLESLMGALVQALNAGDTVESNRLAQSLQLPDAEAWFGEVFGDELGPPLLAEHEPQRGGIGWLASHIKGRIETGLVAIRAERFESPDEEAAVGYQSAALARMKKRVPLYSVRFATPDGKKTWHVWSFVHHQGTFRYVGKMRKVVGRLPPKEGRDLLEYRLSDAARVKASMEQ